MAASAAPVPEESPPLEDIPGTEENTKAPWCKVLLLGVGVGILLAIVYLSPLREYLSRLREISTYIRGLGLCGPLVLTLSIAVLVGIGFPRLLFCVLAGMAFGFWWGLLWAQLGTLLGNYALFLVARWGAKDWARRYLSRRTTLHNLVQEEGVAGVMLARQLPVPGLLVNLACGLFSIRHRHFLMGTIIGQLPEAIPCTLIGAGALATSFKQSAGLIALAVAVAVAAWIGLRAFARQRRRRGTELSAGPAPGAGS